MSAKSAEDGEHRHSASICCHPAGPAAEEAESSTALYTYALCMYMTITAPRPRPLTTRTVFPSELQLVLFSALLLVFQRPFHSTSLFLSHLFILSLFALSEAKRSDDSSAENFLVSSLIWSAFFRE
jgi:hypothetical protein